MYTSREELGHAYTKMLIEEKHNRNIYNLVGEGITQRQLADSLNEIFHTNLIYNSISFASYLAERKLELGEFIGTVIAGIYDGIKNGAYDVLSDFEKAGNRPHKSTLEIMKDWKNSQK